MAEPQNYFRITTHKFWLGPGGPSWANTYEVALPEPSTIGVLALSTIAEAIGQFEQELHVNQVFFDRAVISTDEADGSIYDPATFRIFTYNFFGARNVLGENQRVDLNAVYNVRKLPQFGRPGKLAFRGVICEGDVDAGAQGFWDLPAGSPLGPTGATWLAAYTFLEPHIGGGNDADLCMIQQPTASNPTPNPTPRIVGGLTPLGAGFSRFNHRYFDRGPA